MGRMVEALGSILKDWVSLILLGLGITFSPHMYIGGLFMAFAGAAISRAWEKEYAIKQGKPLPKESPYRFWLVIGTAFFISTLIAILVNAHYANWSIQVVMAASGFASRKLVILALSVIDNLSRKGDTVASRFLNKILPEQNKDNDNDR